MSTPSKPDRSWNLNHRSETAAPKRKGRSPQQGPGSRAFYLIAPTIVLLALVVGYPVVKAIYQSFLTDSGTRTRSPACSTTAAALERLHATTRTGCSSSARLPAAAPGLPDRQAGFAVLASVGVTLLFTVVTVALETIIGMVLRA